MKLTFTRGRSIITLLKTSRRNVVKGSAILLFALLSMQSLKAQLVYAVSSTGSLVSFNASAPGTLLSNVPLSGIAAGQVLEGLDFRPATGQLYALGYNALNGAAQIYTVKLANGVATPIGAAITLATGMSNIGFDFNPTVDRIRVTSSTRQNYRLNPNDGSVAVVDGTLTYATNDVNASATPNVVTVAYTNSVATATTTTLYFFDFALRTFGTINPPNAGTLNTVGNSGLTPNNVTGLDFDIVTEAGTGTNTAYLSADITGSANNFYTVNLTSGATTFVGTIGGGKITEMAIATPTAPLGKLIYAVSGSNLVTFNSATPGTISSSVAITGLGTGETILGIDFRPATGQLYALGSASRLYTINTTTGAATQVGTDGAFTLNGTKFGFDFNPVPDRIRVVSNTEQNLRMNPNDGTAIVDGTLAFAAGDGNAGTNPNVGAVAYTNSYGGATATTLYFYDYILQITGIINPPNAGTLNTLAGSGITPSELGLDMDIASDQAANTNIAFLTASTAANTTSLYRFNLTTGAVTVIGAIGGGSAITTMAVYLPPPPPVKVVYALTATGNLISFNSNAPQTTLSSVALSGVTPGQVVEGLDFRPATGQLYALGYNAGTGQAQLYTVNTTTGVATAVGSAISLAINLGSLAVDFNPQVDRIRVISSTGLNYRVHPDNGTLTVDTPLSYAGTDTRSGAQPAVHGAAYTNNFAGTATTALYYYDFNLDNLAATLPPVSPNLGVLSTVGYSGLSTVSGVDLDIATNQMTGANTGFLLAGINGSSSNFYIIELPSGEAKLLGTIASGNVITEMAVSSIDVVLPVTLTNFMVRKLGSASELLWTTHNELNNDHFILERSTNGRTFNAISGKINSQSGNGNSTKQLNYSFTDVAPEKGINYYRLLQVDKDGNFKHSNILQVTFDGQYEIALYPNPVRNVANINGYVPAKANLNVRLTDGSGKIVALRVYKNQQGAFNAQIPMGNLPAGVYYLQISDGTSVIHTQAVYKN